jgi:hypothetical protein
VVATLWDYGRKSGFLQDTSITAMGTGLFGVVVTTGIGAKRFESATSTGIGHSRLETESLTIALLVLESVRATARAARRALSTAGS